MQRGIKMKFQGFKRKRNLGYRFNGADSWVLSDQRFTGLTDQLTVFAKIKYSHSTVNRVFIGTQGGANGFVIRTDLSNVGKIQFQCHLAVGGFVSAVSTVNVNDDAEHFIAMTYDGATVRAYIDDMSTPNASNSSGSGNVSVNLTDSGLSIGAYSSGVLFHQFDGNNYGVKLAVMSEAELNDAKNGRVSNMDFYVRGDDRAVTDISGKRAGITLNNFSESSYY